MQHTNNNQKVVAAAIRRLELLNKNEAFDPVNPESRPTAAQKDVIEEFGRIRTQWIVAATQSGKSQTCSRLVSWVLTDTHPNWKRPAHWGDEALLILVAGRTGKQIEESLLPKLESYLVPGTYKVVRIGNIAQRLEHENGNRIVFQSLENPGVARERIQSYVAHLAWVDEMPPSSAIIDELQRRVQARNGYFMGSFTPLVVNEDIRRMVDSAVPPFAKKYIFKMFDNPLYADPVRQQEILTSMSSLPESVRNTRLYGDWSQADNNVYYFEYDKMVEFPEDYSPMWRHVESVDPASSSSLGLTIWAENPSTGVWYCVHAEYIKGLFAPTAIIEAVRDRTKNKNIMRRISDPHESWYIHQAALMGLHYIGARKDDRKQELIKNLQERLSNRTVRLSPTCEHLISELQECRWSDRADNKIVNSSSYHLLDSAQYFIDNIPVAEKKIEGKNFQDWLWKANEVRKVNVQKKRDKLEKVRIRNAGGQRRRGSI